MAQPTYRDLLEWLGLSSWQFMAILLGLLMLWPIITGLWKEKIVGKIKVKQVKLPAFKAVYISYLGSYDDIGTIYSQSV